MAIQYENPSRQNVTWTATLGTKQELINQIESVLLAASWTTLSGSGTTNLLMKSATTPDGLAMRLRVKDNGGNCVTITFENANGTIACTNSTTFGMMLLPAAGEVWRFICNKYQGFIFTAGSAAGTARKFACFGVLALPSFLSGVISEAIWCQGNAFGDTDTAFCYCFRVSLTLDQGGNQLAYCAHLINGSLYQAPNKSDATTGSHFIGQHANHNPHGANNWLWHNGACFIHDAILYFWGLGRGFLWDACVLSEQFTLDATSTFDGHNWQVIGSNAGGQQIPRGSLLIATS